MNAQELFDKVVNGLRKQGCKSEEPSEIKSAIGIPFCLYRGPNNLKCAAGQLMEDEEYSPWMEKKTIHFIIRQDATPESFRQRIGLNINLVMRLQQIHDGADVAEWEKLFEHIAPEYDVTYTPPEKS